MADLNKTQKLNKGITESRHVIRPRNVDHNRRLVVSTERDDIEQEMRCPKVPNIDIPLVATVDQPPAIAGKFNRPEYYVRYIIPQDDPPYEATYEDLQFLDQWSPPASTPYKAQDLLERCIEIWEIDTGKGQIIPFERAQYLAEEEKLVPKEYSAQLEPMYNYWKKQREEIKHPILRRFWKSDGITDQQLKNVFNPRSREKMRLRYSRKNDRDSYEKVRQKQMLALKRQFEQLSHITNAIQIREQLKLNAVVTATAAFRQQRAEILGQPPQSVDPIDYKSLEKSKEFRKNVKAPEPPAPLPEVRPPIQPTLQIPKPPPETRIRPAPEPKRIYLTLDVAMACCAVLAERERPQDAVGLTSPETQMPNGTVMGMPVDVVHQKPQIIVRGRVMPGGFVALDRYSSTYEIDYLYTPIKSRNLNKFKLEQKALERELMDEEDNEGFDKFKKTLGAGFKTFMKQRKLNNSH